jgi:DNA-binding response OmpR family regulator
MKRVWFNWPPAATEVDVSRTAPLCDQRILVVEDEYSLATDTADALQRAGAKVLGPFSSEQSALDQIRSEAPTIALLDINLGSGPSFDVARILKQRGVPLVFITGYNQEIIPAEFESAPRLQKPVEMRQIVDLLIQALGLRK